MSTLKLTIAALALAASAGTAFADSASIADRDAYVRNLNAQVDAGRSVGPAQLFEGRQAAPIVTPAASLDPYQPYPNSGLSAADQLRLKNAVERDLNSKN